VVFGGAVTVNAIIAYFQLQRGESASPLMWIGMLLVAVGIVLTAANTPHGHPPKPATADAAQSGHGEVGTPEAIGDGNSDRPNE